MATPFDPRGPSAAWARRALNLAEGDGRSIRAIFAPMPSAPTALLLVAVPRSAEMSADLLREVAELRDRVSVTLAAAEREGRLLARALRDGLTGLLNRDGLQERAAALLSGDGDPRASTLMFIDLDGFKEVNDAHGHLAGDELLVAVADRLHGLAPTGTPLARPGGDEFVLLLPGDAAPAEALAERICTRLAEPFLLREQQVRVGASVGLAVCPDDGRDLLQLMRRADMAMYAAKASGRGVWRRYHEALDEQAAERAWIVRDLHTALEAGGQLTLHYQPRVDARSGTMRSAEALVRWRHPIRGAIAPARFIGIAEDAGLIERLGQQVLTQALQQLRRWRDAGVPVARVSVNVSALQLRDDRFTASVLRQLDRLGLAADGLELEITESLFMRDIDAVCARLAPMRERGVVIALDDFGTGYSSMAALHQLPVDVLKIDRSFVADLGQRATADAVVRSVLLLARALGKRVVAEGVETPTQRAHLTELGCDELQGYLFSRPVPAADLEAWAQRGVVGRVAAPA